MICLTDINDSIVNMHTIFFNRLDCLENCLESILISSRNVNDFNFEVCISDNFSSEDPISIINKYKKRFKNNIQ